MGDDGGLGEVDLGAGAEAAKAEPKNITSRAGNP